MALYKREKINPLSGCLPVLIQLPVFFALYKVLVITIEMRQAPFFGWIKDLSQPDPTESSSICSVSSPSIRLKYRCSAPTSRLAFGPSSWALPCSFR